MWCYGFDWIYETGREEEHVYGGFVADLHADLGAQDREVMVSLRNVALLALVNDGSIRMTFNIKENKITR